MAMKGKKSLERKKRLTGKKKLQRKKKRELKRIRNELDNGPTFPAAECANQIASKIQFEHTSLTNPGSEIRLFELQPTATHDTIKLNLRTWKLQKCPKYIAVSYVWGDPSKCQTIEVNGKTLGTTSNAFYALQQVINQHRVGSLRTSHFWMDLICIDQANLDEKGKQVYLMGDIYERAAEVLACVGPHADNSALVMEVFRDARIDGWVSNMPSKYLDMDAFYVAIDKMWTRLEGAVSTKWQEKLIRRRGESVQDFCLNFMGPAVLDFCNRPYWHRMWIVQEIMLPRCVKLLCGSSSLELCCLAPCLRKDFLRERPWTLPWAQSRMFAVVQESHHTREAGGVHMDADSVFSTLYDNECSDFRDRVYALLRVIWWPGHVASSGQLKILPDYSITKLGLIRQVAIDLALLDESCTYKLWGTLSGLYRTLRLTIDSPEIAKLVEERTAVSEVATCTKISIGTSSSQSPTLMCEGLHGNQLESCLDGLALPAPFYDSSRTKWPLLETALSEIRRPKVKVDGKQVGWACSEAQPGDYLVSGMVYPDDPMWTPHLIIRRAQKHDPISYKIIGHAVLYKEYMPKNFRSCTLRFDIDDVVTLVALRDRLRSQDYTVKALNELLELSPTRAEYSSSAEMIPREKRR